MSQMYLGTEAGISFSRVMHEDLKDLNLPLKFHAILSRLSDKNSVQPAVHTSTSSWDNTLLSSRLPRFTKARSNESACTIYTPQCHQ